MSERPKVIAFDSDADSLACLRRAFPNWAVEVVDGATPDRLAREWIPGDATLLVVGVRVQRAETLGLCRALRSQAGRAHTPLLVLVSPDDEDMVPAALAAGAHSCLYLPVHAKELVKVMARALDGNQPGRHTLGLDRAQQEDHWQDEGGEA